MYLGLTPAIGALLGWTVISLDNRGTKMSTFQTLKQTSNQTQEENYGTRRSKMLAELGEQIADLLQFVTPRHNIHGDIKKKINVISSTHSKLLKLDEKVVTASPKSQKISVTTQTSPKRADTMEQSPMSQKHQEDVIKRKETIRTNERCATKKVKKTICNEPVAQPLPTQNNEEAESKEKWQKVKKKGRKEPTSLPNALIIRKQGQLSYAEILSKVKKDDTLKEVGEHVSKIRRTMAGDIILILDKASKENTAKFCTAIKSSLGEEAAIESRVQQVTLEIKDLDETITKEEIVEALQRDLNKTDVKIDAIKTIRKAYGGTQTALVNLPVETAKKLAEIGKLRIGWVVCRVRELIIPTKCYRCWHYGHLAKNCKSDVDRSTSCIKCGKQGHKADKCNSKPHCILCSESKGEKASEHIAGSSRCAAYKRAYQKCLQRKRK